MLQAKVSEGIKLVRGMSQGFQLGLLRPSDSFDIERAIEYRSAHVPEPIKERLGVEDLGQGHVECEDKARDDELHFLHGKVFGDADVGT